MLRIIKGGFYSACKQQIYSEIEKLASEGKPSILIVPEQQTVLTESTISKIIPPSASTVFEVTNFTRLANTVFRALGGLSGEYCNASKSALIMWRALTELSPILSITSTHKEISAGLVNSMLGAVSEMQSHGIHPAELADAAEAIKNDRRLAGKLNDLSRVFSLYKTLLSEKYADSGDDAEAMIKKLTEHPSFLSDTEIYVEGFTSFTEPQYSLLGLLAARSSLTVCLTVSPGREDAFEFTEVRECEERIIRTARQTGAEIKLIKEEGFWRGHAEALAEICSELWSVSPCNDNITLQNADVLRIFEAQTPFEECEFICADIRRRVMAGASYSDFAIVCRSIEKYAGILDSSLHRSKIPFFSSYRRDVSEFEAIKFIYSAYSAIRGYSRENVVTYAKCPFSGISREECDEFEAYVNTWQISGKRFTDGENWSMNPLGYTTERPEGTDEKLKRINLTRDKLISPLLMLEEETSKASTAKEQTQVLLNFLLNVNAEEMLERRAELLSSLGEGELAKENRALWGVIIETMDSLYEVLGELPCNAEAFLSQLKATLSSAEIGSIPAFTDVVTVGRADMLRLNGKPHVYMLGVNSGEFPAAVGDSSYFSEHDKETLSALGLSVKSELAIKDARELYIFSRVFSYATDTITLSYSISNTKFKATSPSDVIGRICSLTGGVKPIRISALPIESRIFSARDAFSEIGNLGESYSAVRDALISSGNENELLISEGEVSNGNLRLGDSALLALYSKPLSLTQTRIDKYVSCPFGHFCKYTLSLSEDRRAEFNAANIGSFIHSILENFFRAVDEGGKPSSELTAEERISLTKQAAKKYVEEIGEDTAKNSARTKTKIDRLMRAALPIVDGLCEEFSESLFVPKFFELALKRGDDDTPDPITFSSPRGDINIYGVIDRIDTYKKGDDVYVRVVDYKTGQKEFSPDDMAEGANLQMFLYLKSIIDSQSENFKDRMGAEQSGRLIPAGVIYVKTSVGDVRIDTPDDKAAEDAVKANQAREGMVLNDPEILSAMGMKYTPVYSEKTPDKVPPQKEKYLFTEEEFGEIMQTVEESVIHVADGMREGKIGACPKPNGKVLPCEYCEFKPICRASAK